MCEHEYFVNNFFSIFSRYFFKKTNFSKKKLSIFWVIVARIFRVFQFRSRISRIFLIDVKCYAWIVTVENKSEFVNFDAKKECKSTVFFLNIWCEFAIFSILCQMIWYFAMFYNFVFFELNLQFCVFFDFFYHLIWNFAMFDIFKFVENFLYFRDFFDILTNDLKIRCVQNSSFFRCFFKNSRFFRDFITWFTILFSSLFLIFSKCFFHFAFFSIF